MDNCNVSKITPEVSMDSKIFYLIRADGEEMAFCDSEEEAVIVINSLANVEQKNLENKWTKVFREGGDKKIIIFTQQLGTFYNGPIIEALTLDIVSVGHAFLTKGIHELPQKIDSDVQLTTVPIPDILQRLAGIKTDPVEDVVEDEKKEEITEEKEVSVFEDLVTE